MVVWPYLSTGRHTSYYSVVLHQDMRRLLVVAVLVLLTSCREAWSLDANAMCPTHGTHSQYVEGHEAPQGERPWVALLWISCDKTVAGQSYMKTCAGSIIDPEWVLTTAGCFPCGNQASVVIDVGLHHSNIRLEMLHGRAVDRVGADGVFIHPHYDNQLHKHDIALVHLSKPVNSSHTIPLVDCSQKDGMNPGRDAISSGWGGSIKYSSLDAKPMHDAFVALWSSETCSMASTGKLSSGVFCAGSKMYSNINSTMLKSLLNQQKYSNRLSAMGSEPPCFVEHGSSLAVRHPRVITMPNGVVKVACEWQLCGILSFGLQCQDNMFPGFFTDVCMYSEWIVETMKIQQGRDS